MEVLFLYHNSGSFHGEVDPLSVVDQMKIHGILCAERIVGCDCVCNLTMGFDCFLMQCISSGLVYLIGSGRHRGRLGNTSNI